MDQHHLHLILNHFPVILSVMAVFASVLGMVRGSRTAWVYAAASLTIAGALAYPVMLTGHGAEHAMRSLWYVKRGSWAGHEDAADWATWILVGDGVIAAWAWWKLTRAPGAMIARWLQLLVLVASLFGASTVGRAAWLGGKVMREQDALKTPPPGWVAPAPRTGPDAGAMSH